VDNCSAAGLPASKQALTSTEFDSLFYMIMPTCQAHIHEALQCPGKRLAARALPQTPSGGSYHPTSFLFNGREKRGENMEGIKGKGREWHGG